MELALYFLVLALLLALNGFFVLAEFAIIKVRSSRIQEIADGGDARAKLVAEIQGKLDEYLSVCQVGITFASVALGMVGQKATDLIMGSSDDLVRYVIAISVSYIVVSGSHIVLGELVPKSIAIRVADRAAMACAKPLRFFHWLFYLPLFVLNRLANLCLRMLGMPPSSEESPHSEDELRIILDQSQEHGLMSFRRLLFMENVFEIGELTAKDAMRHRSQVRCLNAELHWKDTLDFLATWPYSRFPLIDQDPEKPAGFIHVKDLFYQRYFYRAQTGDPIDLRNVARPLLNFPETAPLESVLAEMQRKRLQMGLVVNAEGRWTGVITLEDILEELVGTIGDEFESEPPLSLSDHLTEGRVVLDIEAANLGDALRMALGRIPESELPFARDAIVKAVMERERLAGTYLGKGIALPHARLPGLTKAALMVVRSRVGIPVEGSAEKARLLFVLLTPAGQPRVHQRLQAQIAGILENSEYVEDHLLEATTPAEVVEILRTGEQTTLD